MLDSHSAPYISNNIENVLSNKDDGQSLDASDVSSEGITPPKNEKKRSQEKQKSGKRSSKFRRLSTNFLMKGEFKKYIFHEIF